MACPPKGQSNAVRRKGLRRRVVFRNAGKATGTVMEDQRARRASRPSGKRQGEYAEREQAEQPEQRAGIDGGGEVKAVRPEAAARPRQVDDLSAHGQLSSACDALRAR